MNASASSIPQPAKPPQLLLRLLGLAWKYRTGCLKLLAAQLLLLCNAVLMVWVTGLGIDQLRHAVDPAAPPPQWPDWIKALKPLLLSIHLHFSLPEEISPLQATLASAAGVLFLAALRLWLGYLSGLWSGELLQGRLVVDMRERCYEKLQRLPLGFESNTTSSSLINRVGGDVQSVRLFVDGVLVQVVMLAVSVAAYLAYMLTIHVRLTLSCLATTPVILLVTHWFSRSVRPEYRRASEMSDSLVQRLAESIRGITVVRGFGRDQSEVARFESANDALRDQQRQIFRKISLFVPGTLFLSQANTIVLLGYGGVLAVRGEIGVGTGLVGFASILSQLTGQIANIGNIANSMQQSLQAAERVFEILDSQPDVPRPARPTVLPTIRGRIKMEGVTLVRNGKEVLRNVSLLAEPGQCVGIVGPTGSGKSSVLQLVPRFCDPAQGRVLIDGIDVRELDPETLRRSIGVVFQESFLFGTTVAANIAYGAPEASRERIERAAKLAQAHGFISALPNGYDTVLGEGGIGLSGGQRQRLALARALLLEPPILLLDDPTAAVDAETEAEIVSAVESAMHGRTTLVVAHRPAMLRQANKLVVLDRGEAVQTGSPRELLQQAGYYRESLRLQNGEAQA